MDSPHKFCLFKIPLVPLCDITLPGHGAGHLIHEDLQRRRKESQSKLPGFMICYAGRNFSFSTCFEREKRWTESEKKVPDFCSPPRNTPLVQKYSEGQRSLTLLYCVMSPNTLLDNLEVLKEKPNRLRNDMKSLHHST